MTFFKEERIYNLMKNKNKFFMISVVLILSSFILLFTKGINYGVDFSGGTVIQIKYNSKAPIEQVRNILHDDKVFKGSYVTFFGSKQEIVIKTKMVNSDLNNDSADLINEVLKPTGDFEIRRVDVVGAKIGSELREKGILSLVLSLIVLLIYVSWRFEYRFAIASILALIHDSVITLGAIVLFQIDFNLDILAAILMILGYSINDTIIVFDRIREELKENSSVDLTELINTSVSKTLSRTTLTSLTTLFVVLTLYIFGGEIINGFSFTLLIGIIVGTYSSIFIASSFLFNLNFNIKNYKKKELQKEQIRKEKERLRSMYENGTV
jgi:preprotein translocase subunit SecF